MKAKTSGEVEIISDQNGKSIGKFAFHNGEFFKVLGAGNYKFKVTSNGNTQEFDTTVTDKIDTNGNYYQL